MICAYRAVAFVADPRGTAELSGLCNINIVKVQFGIQYRYVIVLDLTLDAF